MIERGDPAALDDALGTWIGIAPPRTPRVAAASGFSLVWAGRGRWLLIGKSPEKIAAATSRLAGLVAVSDQSDGYVGLRLSGPRLRDVFMKGCFIDLHPRAFGPGDTALTTIAHIGVHFWELDATPTYDLVLFRSMAGSFWSWLSTSAAEYGYEIVDTIRPQAAPQ
jgi:sarcosine oxidase subunit gamma